MATKAYLNWSSGKDAAFALFELQKKSDIRVEALVTTINSKYNRVSMHGIPITLLEKQAKAIGIPLKTIALNGTVSMEAYNELMRDAVLKLKDDGFKQAVFGDIFLDDLKTYREQQFKPTGLHPVFPLWKRETSKLASKIINSGFKAIVICVNASVLEKGFCGRFYDDAFLKDLPEGVDPCGENGEFHTFVFDGPNFSKVVSFKLGKVTKRSYPVSSSDDESHSQNSTWDNTFWYADLLPN